MPTLYFTRHGESTSNGHNIFSGQHDNAQLTSKGIEQARAVGRKIKNEEIKIDRIIASTLARTQQTAQIIAEEIGFDSQAIEKEPRLMEYEMGEREGSSREGVTYAMLAATPGAEQAEAFMQRVRAVLDELKETNATILLVSHAGVGRIIRCINEGRPAEDFYPMPPYPNATLIKLS